MFLSLDPFCVVFSLAALGSSTPETGRPSVPTNSATVFLSPFQSAGVVLLCLQSCFVSSPLLDFPLAAL